MNSCVRWSYTNEPVRSAGSRSGVNCARVNVEPERLRERACRERLAESGQILEQHVSAGEDAAQHERQGLTLADDGAVHLVENLGGQPRRRCDVDRVRGPCVTHRASMSATMRSRARKLTRRGGCATTPRSAGVRTRSAAAASRARSMP